MSWHRQLSMWVYVWLRELPSGQRSVTCRRLVLCSLQQEHLWSRACASAEYMAKVPQDPEQ